MLSLGYVPLLIVILVLGITALFFRFFIYRPAQTTTNPTRAKRSVDDLIQTRRCPHCGLEFTAADNLLQHLPQCRQNPR